ncbi:uncharacterized protein LOC143695482 [Agelaius phoeniceus]|uniref:uncharacterized protein LOC143695482 n=1 Tax=Agelaius phoeniceus TaxID=39638 RepID=UPI0040553039
MALRARDRRRDPVEAAGKRNACVRSGGCLRVPQQRWRLGREWLLPVPKIAERKSRRNGCWHPGLASRCSLSGCSSLRVEGRTLCWRMGGRSLLVAVSSVGTELWPGGLDRGRTTELVLVLPRALVFELPSPNWS